SQRSFGMHRAEVLAAQANAFSLLVVTGWIGYAAVVRLLHPEAVRGGIVLVVAALAAVVNLGAALVLREDVHGHGLPLGARAAGERGASSKNLNMRAAVTHLGADAAASAGVALAGAVILATGGWYRLDPAISLAIALL